MRPFKFLMGLLAICVFALCVPQSTTAAAWDGGPGISIVLSQDNIVTTPVVLDVLPFDFRICPAIAIVYKEEAIGSATLVLESLLYTTTIKIEPELGNQSNSNRRDQVAIKELSAV